ncbi:hypothetical protein MUK42_13042 [Musa troglodytarum]|uniref:Uncharacterized protein n=1 Tax=Musa troglodytarum TaxID=320322 RepID=A0A9E7KZC3_9LILI|nr:hypothetical protein MUK42_13042 [Musa troglodytarum]
MGPRHPSPAQPAPLLSFLSPCGRRQQTGACSFSADGDEDDEEDEAVEDDDGDESKEDEPSPFDVRSLPSVRFLFYLASLVPMSSLRLEIILLALEDDLPDVNNHFSDRKLSMLYSAVSNEKLGTSKGIIFVTGGAYDHLELHIGVKSLTLYGHDLIHFPGKSITSSGE